MNRNARVDGADVFILVGNLGRVLGEFSIPEPPAPGPGPFANADVVFSLSTPAAIEGIGASGTFDVGLFAGGMSDVKELEVAVEWEPADALVADRTTLASPGFPVGNFINLWPITTFGPGHVEYCAIGFGNAYTGDASLGVLTFTTSPSFSESTPLTLRVTRVALGPMLPQQDVFRAGSSFDLKVTVNAVNIAALIRDVQGLAAAGALNKGQANALMQKLGNASKQVDKGSVGAAINQLNAFTNQVSAFVRSGILLAAGGQPLLDRAAAVIGKLGKMSAKPVTAGVMPGSWGEIRAQQR